MKKRILPALLALAMVLTMLPMASFAAVTPGADGTAEVGTADDLKEALTNEQATTIKLTTDISVAEALTISRGVTIDLGTHTLTSSVVNGTNSEGKETNTYAVTVSATDKVTIKNGTLSAAGCAGIQSAVDTVTVIELNGLKMTAKKWSVVNRANSTMTVTDCEVTSTNGYAVENNAGSTLNASNSTFSGANWLMLNRASGTMNLTGCSVTASGSGAVENNGGTMTISGGQYQANGVAVVNHLNGTMNLSTTAISAVNYAVENDGQMKITGGNYSTTNGADAISTIMCGTDSAKDQTPAPSLEIANAQVSSTNGNGITPANGASVIIGDGTVVTAKGNALGGNNTRPTQNTTIQAGAKLTSQEGAAVYQAAAGSLTIAGGELTGKAGVVVRAGTVDVTGGTITANGTVPLQVGDRTETVPASGIVYDLKANYDGSAATDSKVTVGGDATIKAANDQEAVTLVQPDAPVAATNKMEVTGGTFDKPVDPEYLADNLKYQAVDGSGSYTYHETVEEAKDAAGDDGVVSEKDDSGVMQPIVTYSIKITGAPEKVGADVEGTGVSATLTVTGTSTVTDALLKITVTKDGNPVSGDDVQLMATDTDGNEWNLVETGVWGPAGGFTPVTATTQITKYCFKEAGEYEIKVELVTATDPNTALATGTATVTVTANANPDLEITDVTPDVVGFAKAKVSGMIADKTYVIRLAKSSSLDSDSIILVVTGVTEYEFTCKVGQKAYVLEFNSKGDLQGVTGDDGKLHLTPTSELPEHAVAKVQ